MRGIPMYPCFKAKLRYQFHYSSTHILGDYHLCPSLVDGLSGLSWWSRLSNGGLSGSSRGLSGSNCGLSAGRNLSCAGSGLAAASGKGGCRVRPGCNNDNQSESTMSFFIHCITHQLYTDRRRRLYRDKLCVIILNFQKVKRLLVQPLKIC